MASGQMMPLQFLSEMQYTVNNAPVVPHKAAVRSKCQTLTETLYPTP